MKINIKGYRNIGELSYEITYGKINMLFGISGSGKSSIAKAVMLEDLDYNKQIGYGGEVHIDIDGDEPKNKKILLFDDKSENNYIFDQQNEHVFNILVDNDNELLQLQNKIDTSVKTIDEQLLSYKYAYDNSKDLIGKFGSKLTKKGIFSTSAKIEKILKSVTSPKISKYYKELNDLDSQKANWMITGASYIEDNKCPFCEKKMSQQRINRYMNYRIIDGKNLDLIRTNNSKINDLLKCDFNMTPKGFQTLEQSLIENAIANLDYEKVIECSESLKKGQIIKPETLNLSNQFKDYYPELDKTIKKINRNMIALVDKSKKVKQETNKLLSRSVKKVNKQIQRLGIPYEISASYYRSKITDYKLSFIGDSSKIDRKNSLSNGEKNVVSLLLFILDAKKKDSDLIIIDDPVSSFDVYRRHVILDIIKEELKGKTVLVLSHDNVFAKFACFNSRNTAGDVIGNVSYFDNFKNSSTIIPIQKEDFDQFDNYVADRLRNCLDYYQKIINLRMLYERKHSTIEYAYLSAILHLSTKEFVQKELMEREYTEEDVINKINSNYGICLPSYEGEIDISKLNTDNYSILEKAIVLREMYKDDGKVKKIIKPELDNIIHLNDRLDICLNPYKYSFCTPYTLQIIDEWFGKLKEKSVIKS